MSLPAYSDDVLAARSTPELVRLLIRDEDRVPRNVIDECVRRGDEMLDMLSPVLDEKRCWTADAAEGERWLPLHAVMILGLIPGDRAGGLLAGFMRRIDEKGDDNLQSGCYGIWPALFRNKPQSVIVALRDLAQDRDLEPFVRVDAAQVVVARAKSLDGACLDEALAWAAGIAFDEKEDMDVRMSVGELLLDFARPEYRAGLEELATKVPAWETAFTEEDVAEVYACPDHEEPDWSDSDPWSFYAPEKIEGRQQDWAQENDRPNENDFIDEPMQTYVRDTPKVGRNDPCPCGSGKKYKKCCLGSNTAS